MVSAVKCSAASLTAEVNTGLGRRFASMKFNVVTYCYMMVYLALITKGFVLPTSKTSTADDLMLNKRTSIASVRRSIHELEQIERYCQQLLVRGYLPETDIRQLELLQQLIEQMKRHLQTLINAEQAVRSS